MAGKRIVGDERDDLFSNILRISRTVNSKMVLFENVKGILIINPLRNKPLDQRDNVHEKQIQLARRNGSLIVSTDVLLSLFVAYLENHVSTEKVIELFKNNTGLLQASDFI